jgi:hypothetical protein
LVGKMLIIDRPVEAHPRNGIAQRQHQPMDRSSASSNARGAMFSASSVQSMLAM